jgi:magnesium transporter
MADARTRVYVKGKLDAEDFPVDQLSEQLDRPDSVVWVDFCRPSRQELDALVPELGLHPLAIEDAMEPHQRPKLDRYSSHLFLSCHALSLDAGEAELRETELDIFIGTRWLVTVRDNDGFPVDPVLGRWDDEPELVAYGLAYLVHGLLDEVVDGYLDTISQFDDYFEQVSEGIFSESPLPISQQREWFQMRRMLAHFHKLVSPMREAVTALMHRDKTPLPSEVVPYFQDLYDHVLTVNEATDSLRDLVASIAETNLSLRDYRQNQVMKKVSSWAAIIAVPTLITGYYGMNVPYPTSGRSLGVVVSTGLTVLTCLVLYWQFRRRDWL